MSKSTPKIVLWPNEHGKYWLVEENERGEYFPICEYKKAKVAPDLLEACKRAEQMARDYGEDCLVDILAGAINKAEGK